MDEKSQKNQTMELIKNRRTIRAYDPKPLSQDEIDTIIQGAMRYYHPRSYESPYSRKFNDVFNYSSSR